MCNELKRAIQSTVDLININITRDVQEECANRLYRVCTHSSNADDGEWWVFFFFFFYVSYVYVQVFHFNGNEKNLFIAIKVKILNLHIG